MRLCAAVKPLLTQSFKIFFKAFSILILFLEIFSGILIKKRTTAVAELELGSSMIMYERNYLGFAKIFNRNMLPSNFFIDFLLIKVFNGKTFIENCY